MYDLPLAGTVFMIKNYDLPCQQLFFKDRFCKYSALLILI